MFLGGHGAGKTTLCNALTRGKGRVQHMREKGWVDGTWTEYENCAIVGTPKNGMQSVLSPLTFYASAMYAACRQHVVLYDSAIWWPRLLGMLCEIQPHVAIVEFRLTPTELLARHWRRKAERPGCRAPRPKDIALAERRQAEAADAGRYLRAHATWSISTTLREDTTLEQAADAVRRAVDTMGCIL